MKRCLPALLLLLGACHESNDSYTCAPPACAPTSASYAVEIATPTGSALPNLEFTNVSFDLESASFVFALPRVATVHGTVTAGGQYFAGAVIFTRPSRVAGRPDVFYETQIDPQTGAYTLLVPPNATGETYTVHVRPSDPSAFPALTQVLQIDSDRMLDIKVPSGNELLQLHGTLVDVLGLPVSEARVVLRDQAEVDLSTTAVTDAQGVFKVLLPMSAAESSGNLTLSIERGSATTGVIALSVQFASTELKAQLIDQAMKLQLPALPSPTRLSFQVLGSSSSGTDKPIAGAHVRLRAQLVDSMFAASFRAYHEVEGQTGPDGKIEVDLYSNELGTRAYTTSISPPADSEFQTTTTEVTVGTASGVSAPIHLAARPVLTGRVLDPGQLPVKGAVIQPGFISAITGFNATSLATSSKLASATTDADGRFVLRVDQGSYDFGLVPPAASMLPRRWLSGEEVAGDRDLGDLVAPVPLRLDGVLKDSTGAPVSATIRLYSVPVCSGEGDCTALPHLQAEGTTDEAGRAHLLLAADGT